MARDSRQDEPGSWHHVINRGIAKRPLFEDRTDIRFFLSRLAREVRRGRLEIHCWCVLTTHFHLLVRSPARALSEALRRAQNEYSRFFNRRHRRDGTLVRGRFFSEPVTSLTYRRALVRYIDGNAVKAGLAQAPWEYPWCSASQYVFSRPGRPLWLERAWVESETAAGQGSHFRGEDYVRAFGGTFSGAADRLVESRIQLARTTRDDLDDLIGAAPPRVLAWMRNKTRLADGCEVGLPVCDSTSIRDAIQNARAAGESWTVSPAATSRCPWALMEIGLRRTMAGQTWEQIADAVGASLSSCQRRFHLHQHLLEEHHSYADSTAAVGAAALAACLSSSYSARSG